MKCGFGKLPTLFALIWGLLSLSGNMFAQNTSEILVKVGEIKTIKVERQIVEEDFKVEVGNSTIARARFDKNNKEYRIQGLKEGTTHIVFSGNYIRRGLLQSFSERVNVTVLSETGTTGTNPTNTTNPNQTGNTSPNQINTTDSNFYRMQINRHEIKNLSIATLLRQEPDKNIEGLELKSGDNNIARGDYEGRTIRITGIGSGNTSLILTGKIINNNEEQSVRRIIEVTVIADNKPDNTPSDAQLESMRQRLQALKTAAALVGTDELKLNASIKYFGDFVKRVQTAIINESNLDTPNQLREALLKNLRDEADRDLSRLRGKLAEIAKQIRSIGWHTILSDLNLALGELPAERTFSCPANPDKSYGTVYGTTNYLNNSALCPAAVHNNVIGFAGGHITVRFYKGSDGDNYIGSQNNGVTTQSWKRNWGYFIFVKAD